jgi:hypothetical protein
VKPSSKANAKATSTKVKTADPYAKGSTFLSTKAALAAAAIRCNKNNGGDAKCGRLTSPPENASGLCYKARCTFRESLCSPSRGVGFVLTTVSSHQAATTASPPPEPSAWLPPPRAREW